MESFCEERCSLAAQVVASACIWSLVVENGHPTNAHGVIFRWVEAASEIKYVYIDLHQEKRMFSA